MAKSLRIGEITLERAHCPACLGGNCHNPQEFPMKRILLPLVIWSVAVAPSVTRAQAPVSAAPVADWSREAQRAIVSSDESHAHSIAASDSP
jgi:hypothetical protein